MPAETLNCPMCGATASTEAAVCEHCGARLATVACPKCFGMMFVGEKFCSALRRQGGPVEVARRQAGVVPALPRGDERGGHRRQPPAGMPALRGDLGGPGALEKICEDLEKQSAVLGMALPLAKPAEAPRMWSRYEPIHYIPCPVCGELMNRVNFAHCSHVIVNVCGRHGTWFDSDELRRIVEFIQSGGLMQARAQEVADLERQKRAVGGTRGGIVSRRLWLHLFAGRELRSLESRNCGRGHVSPGFADKVENIADCPPSVGSAKEGGLEKLAGPSRPWLGERNRPARQRASTMLFSLSPRRRPADGIFFSREHTRPRVLRSAPSPTPSFCCDGNYSARDAGRKTVGRDSVEP